MKASTKCLSAFLISFFVVPLAFATARAPQSNELKQWLDAARKAGGGSAWKNVAALEAHGTVNASGLQGRWQRIDELGTGRFRTLSDMGVHRTAEGYDGSTRWRQGASGGVHALDSEFARSAAKTQAWIARRGWLDANAAGTVRFGPIERRSESGRRYVVVQAQPEGGAPVTLWFDAASRLLERTVSTMPISIDTVRYSGYRSVSGLQLPMRIESRSSGSTDVETVQVQQWKIVRQVPNASRFAAPMPPDDTLLQGETVLPLSIDGFVIVRAQINDRDFDFILDTGGHNILTPATARELGLTPEGRGASGGAGSGQIEEQYLRVQSLKLGDALLRDQHFFVLPLSYGTVERDPGAPLAGILGLEIFERFGVRLDYPAKTLTLRKLAGYEHRGGGTPVPLRFEDDMPQVNGRIEGIEGVIALDTGNTSSTVIQPVWAQRHGLAQKLKAQGVRTVSFGAGGESVNWASRLSTIELGGHRIERPIVRYPEDTAGAFTSRTEAANVGTDVLAHFVIDFDYGHGMAWFEPRPGYEPAAFNRAGLRAIKEGPQSFRVVAVSAGSPAQEAGFARGDEIVAVDGVSASQMSARALSRRLGEAAGTQIVLRVRDKDGERDRRLKLVPTLE